MNRISCRALAGFIVITMLIILPALSPASNKITPKINLPEDADETLRTKISRAKESVYPALINISLVKKRYRSGTQKKFEGGGSGVILTGDGYAVTNYHVAEQAEQIKVTLSDHSRYDAKLVGKDALTDLAVLKLDKSQLPEGKTQFPHASLGQSDKVSVGDYVLAMGNPWMMSQSVTLGIVSNNNRVFFSRDGSNHLRFGENLETGMFTKWIQHDASISPGSSGGPLVNLDGEVIGINARGAQIGGDMGFAIPSNQVRTIMDQLIEEGSIARSWTGIGGRAIQETDYDSGVLISSVSAGSPAHEAGLEPGDLIQTINGESITVKFTEQLAKFYRRLSSYPVGDTVAFQVLKDTGTVNIQLNTKKLPQSSGEKATLKSWGMNVQEITVAQQREKGLNSAPGVLVSNIRSGGPASNAQPAIQGDDMITAINGDSVGSFKTFMSRYRDTSGTSADPVLLTIDRNGNDLLSVLEPEEPREVVERAREMSKAWLGVKTQVMTEKLRRHTTGNVDYGVRITRIYDRTNAAESDLQVGDIITKIGDQDVKTRHDYQQGVFKTAVERMAVGSSPTLRIVRDTRVLRIAVTLEEAPEKPGDVPSFKENTFDVTVRELTFFDKVESNWSRTIDGVVIKDIESGGWAGLAGLQAGDLIQEINGTTVENIDQVQSIMEEIVRNKPEQVPVQVRRKQESWHFIMKPEWKQTQSKETNNNE